MKLSAEVIAAKRRVGLIWLPAIRQREINRSGDHPVVDDSRQRGKQHLMEAWGSGHLVNHSNGVTVCRAATLGILQVLGRSGVSTSRRGPSCSKFDESERRL